MAETTLISWAHGSFNGWVSCTRCAPECVHCYIDREIRKQIDWQSPLNPKPKREPFGHVYLTKTWGAPYKMQAQLKQTPGIYKRMFTCSLSDFFHPMVDGRKFDFDAATLKQLTVSQRVSDISTMTWRDYAWLLIGARVIPMSG